MDKKKSHELVGKVVSASNNKTITVLVETHKMQKREEKDYEKKNVSNRSSSSSNKYDDGQPGYGRGF